MIEHRTLPDGNVFLDIGFDPDEAANLLVRTDLMIAIEQVIQARGLKQREAAKLFGVSQPRISDLMRGKLDAFTIDSLVNMLGKAGMRVSVRVSEPTEAATSTALPAPEETAAARASADMAKRGEGSRSASGSGAFVAWRNRPAMATTAGLRAR